MQPSQIQEAVENNFEMVVQHRRYLHAHPELSFQESRTCEYLAGVLTDWGVPFERKGETGLVAYLRGEQPDAATIALRADTDALPIREANNVPYASQNEGVMHACGHDVHTAAMLGVVSVLHNNPDAFQGTIKVLFQPGEEQAPGGANLMIRDGVLEDPAPEVIIGQHVHPELPAGSVGLRSGPFMASSDEVRITVHGKGGHAAMPHKLSDPVLIASHIVVSLQQMVSRWADPNMPTVLSFGRIQGDGASNVIPDQVYLEGTFRTFDEAWRTRALTQLREMAEHLAQGMGARAAVQISQGYPALYNDEALTNRIRERAEAYLGPENVVELPPRPTAEDFAFYAQQLPAAFYRLGVADPARPADQHALHTTRFDIDEESLKPGVGVMVYTALQEMAYQVQQHVKV
jgi:amidohydrolase